jgi:hypothetical protein
MKKTLTFAALLTALGCNAGPSRVTPPSIDEDEAASQAMELYDKDGDGSIAAAELDAAPSLKASMATLDKNKDGSVQEDEIVARIEAWQSSGVGITLATTRVTMDGRPLVGATVTYEPEPFLGDALKTATGVTSDLGATEVIIPKEDRPGADWPPGIQYGLFKVRISKKSNGSETIPAKYNTETILGQQISNDDPAVSSQNIKFELTSK